MKATYTGGKKLIGGIRYPKFTFTARPEEAKDLDSLVEYLNENVNTSWGKARRSISARNAAEIGYTGYYGVTSWKESVRKAYAEWKRNR